MNRKCPLMAGPASDDGRIMMSKRKGHISGRNSVAGEQFQGSLTDPPLMLPLKGTLI